MLRALATVCLLTALVRADGLYFSQAIGIGASDDPSIGRALRTRASLGARIGGLAIEPWVTADTQTDRDGAFTIIGGSPGHGRSDLAYYGLDVKLLAPLQRTRDIAVDGYVRGGGSFVTATGALAGYTGYGIGTAAGVQLRGRVRALGYAWTPLFFVHKGPKVTGALFAEAGYERVHLAMGSASRTTRISHTMLGFSIGSAF